MVHVVREGEHLSSIAAAYKFRDFHTIWDDPANSELKLRRANPNVLFPGDRIYIPDKKLKSVGASTGCAHVFRVNAPSLVLRIQLVQLYGEPISHCNCDLTVESDVFHVESDAQGTVERRISTTARHGNLELHERIPTKDGEANMALWIPIEIGDLDPIDERSGQEARLSNLGYYRHPVGDTDEQEFASAVEEFQCEHNLDIDGICGPLTKARLLEVHGC